MKKIIFFILLSLNLHAFGYAEADKDLFDNGVLHFKQGQYQKAVNEFTKLIKLTPDNADAYKNRGVSYMKQEKFDLAIKDFEKAKELFPELKGLYSNLGVAWYYKQEYEKAIENYDIEIEMSSENHVAYFNRALCLAELGRKKEALADLSKTLELKPDFYWAICYKADLLAEQEGEEIKAIEAYEEAIRQDPENTYATEKLTQFKSKEALKKNESLEETESANVVENKPEKVELTKKEPKNTQKIIPATSEKGYTLQAGAFLSLENANKLKTRLLDKGFDARVLPLNDSTDRTWYLVRSGHYKNHDEARKASVSLKDTLKIKPVIRSLGTW